MSLFELNKNKIEKIPTPDIVPEPDIDPQRLQAEINRIEAQRRTKGLYKRGLSANDIGYIDRIVNEAKANIIKQDEEEKNQVDKKEPPISLGSGPELDKYRGGLKEYNDSLNKGNSSYTSKDKPDN
jgi:hypothetical protein